MPVLNAEKKVREIVALQMMVDETELTPSTNIIEDLDGDPLDLAMLVMRVEEEFEFEVEIPDDDADKLKTVGDFVRYCTDL